LNKKLLIWELIGIIFIIFLGSAFHFLFEWSGSWIPIGMIAPINESVWEHLELTYWPLIIFTVIQYKFINKESDNILFAKLVAVILMNLIIVIFFYSYTQIIGEDLLTLDIFSFILAVVVGQLISYKILTFSNFKNKTSIISFIGLILCGFLFIIFTFFPPRISLFQDPLTGTYGII